MRHVRWILALALGVLAGAPPPSHAAPDPVSDAIRRGAAAIAPTVRTPLARAFLDACASLPPPPARVLYHDAHGEWFAAGEAAAQPESLRARLTPDSLEAPYFYQTRYGSILNYARIFEVLGGHGVPSLDHKRLLDFGYGRIGHLRALAAMGADAVGVDVDPILRALYAAPGDQGDVPGAGGRAGRVTAVTGWFPGDPATRAAVGAGYDLVISKNTLKGGHTPEQRERQRRVIDLGVSDSAFVAAVAACLKPGGLFVIYTISGPRGNAGCPFTEAMLIAAGFEIVAYDADDSPGAQSMMKALHRGQDAGEVPDDQLTALYTLVRKANGR